MAAVAPVGAHGVQRIGDADDPDHLRQLPAFQPGGVAFAVEPLVVVAGTAVGLRQKFQPLENFSAPDGVLLHDVELLVRQPGGFVEDGVRHGDLSDVMEQGAPVEAVQLLAGEAHMRPDEAGIFGHPVGVLAGVAVFFVYHLADGGHRAHHQLPGLADGGMDLTFHLFFALLLLDAVVFVKDVRCYHQQTERPVGCGVEKRIVPAVECAADEGTQPQKTGGREAVGRAERQADGQPRLHEKSSRHQEEPQVLEAVVLVPDQKQQAYEDKGRV